MTEDMLDSDAAEAAAAAREAEQWATAEVWCEQCVKPTERIVRTTTGDHRLCHNHAAALEYKLYSASWREKGVA